MIVGAFLLGPGVLMSTLWLHIVVTQIPSSPYHLSTEKTSTGSEPKTLL